MPPKPTPSSRGCFQCSRRRIICDKGEPSCGKCIKKGIPCSGQGRIRFADGVARRGKLKDCKIPVKRGDEEAADIISAQVAYKEVRWKSEQKGGRARKYVKQPNGKDCVLENEMELLSGDHRHAAMSEASAATEADEEVERYGEENDIREIISSTQSNVRPWLPLLSSESRMLFSYCQSNSIFETAHNLQII
jgi:hypothetical protein